MTKRLHYFAALILAVLLAACGSQKDSGMAPEMPKDEEASNAAAPSDDEAIQPGEPGAPASIDAPAPPSPSAPAAEAESPLSLQITAEKQSETRLGLVKLTWSATGRIEELYVWSDGFNRLSQDQSQDDPCGPISDASMNATRNLLVNSIDGPNLGYDLNDGSPAHTALIPYLDSARLCDGTLCEGFSGTMTAPACRMDLDPRRSQPFYTRALTPDAVYHLCAKTADGTVCAASDAVAADAPFIDPASAAFSPSGDVRFTIQYANALREAAAPQGCAKVNAGSSYSDRNRGRGILIADCPLVIPPSLSSLKAVRADAGSLIAARRPEAAPADGKKIIASADVRFWVQGIGEGNTATDGFDIDASNPAVTLSQPYGFAGKNGCSGVNDCEGTLKINAHIARSVTVTRAGTQEVIAEGTSTAGIPFIFLEHNDDLILPDGRTPDGLPKKSVMKLYESAGAMAVTPQNGGLDLTFTSVIRNHKSYRWHAYVKIDGHKFTSADVSLPYAPKFEYAVTDKVVAPVYGAANEDGNPIVTNLDGHAIVLTTQHIKDIGGNCRSDVGPASYTILHPGWGYALTAEGRLHPTVIVTNPTGGANLLECRFWGVSHDGQVIDGGHVAWDVPNP